MNETITVKIVTPSNILLDFAAHIVTMPGEEGVFGVLPGHVPLIASLKTGVMNISGDGGDLRYFISSGIAEVTGTNINVITEFALGLTGLKQTEIITKIASLKDEISKETNIIKINSIKTNITRYESLLNVLLATTNI